MTPWKLADKVVGLLGQLIPDADHRDELAAKVRLAVAAANTGWNPQSILALLAGAELVVYLAMASWAGPLLGRFIPWVWAAIAVRVIVVGALLGLDLGELAEALPKLLERLKKQK